MKVRHTVTVDVDVDAWALEYGLEPADVRDHVRAYLDATVDESYPGVAGLWGRTS